MPKLHSYNDMCITMHELKEAIEGLSEHIETLTNRLSDLEEFSDDVVGLTKELNFLSYSLPREIHNNTNHIPKRKR